MIWSDTEHTPKHISMSALLGLIPHFVDEDDPRPAKEQIHERYAHGGGWGPSKGFTLAEDLTLTFPGGEDEDDEVYQPWVVTTLHDETIAVYDCAWTVIRQPDGSFEVGRLD